MNLEEVYEEVYYNLSKNGPDLFFGIYDAKNGSEEFMHGVGMVMEYIAGMVSEECYNEFSTKFTHNMIASKKKVGKRG